MLSSLTVVPDGDAERARSEAAADEAQLRELAASWAARQITTAEWMAARKVIEDRLKAWQAVARAASPQAVRSLIDAEDIDAAWQGFEPVRRREVARVVFSQGVQIGTARWLPPEPRTIASRVQVVKSSPMNRIGDFCDHIAGNQHDLLLRGRAFCTPRWRRRAYVQGQRHSGGNGHAREEAAQYPSVERDRPPCDRRAVASWHRRHAVTSPGQRIGNHRDIEGEFEALVVVFLGGVVTLVTYSFQLSRQQEQEAASRQHHDEVSLRRQQREDDLRAQSQQREDALREQSQQREDDRLKSQEFDLRRAERRRQDEQLRLLINSTLTSYNNVKRIRRVLYADTNVGTGHRLTRGLYDVHIMALMDEQLEFERLKRMAPFIDDERLATARTRRPDLSKDALQADYAEIEEYLNTVIDEWKENRHRLPTDGSPIAMDATFGKLLDFFDKKVFNPNVANRIDSVIKTLLAAVTQEVT